MIRNEGTIVMRRRSQMGIRRLRNPLRMTWPACVTTVAADKPEAIKARRAWQLYTPKAARRNQRSSVRRIPGPKPMYMVEIMARIG